MEEYFYLPGRLRIKIPSLYHNPYVARNLVSSLGKEAGIVTVQVNPLTGKVLIFFEEDKISLGKLKEILEKKSSPAPPKHPESLLAMFKKEEEIFSQGIMVLVSGCLLTYLTIKRLILGPSRLSQTPLMANLSTAATIVTAYPIFSGGLRHLTFRGKITYEFLLTIIALASLFFKENTLGLLVIFLVNLSTFFQTLTFKRSERAINRLVSDKQRYVWLLVNGVEIPATLADIHPGDTIVIHPGEKIIADGQVVQGTAIIDQGSLTGTLEPVIKKEGDWVLAGTTVEEGSIQVLVQMVDKERKLSSLEELIGQTKILPDPTLQINPMAQIASNYSQKLMIISLGLACLNFFLTRDLTSSAALLVVGSPSPAALALSTATGAALGSAAKQGVLVKDVKHLENLVAVDTIFFDKTGTLTLGRPEVRRIVALAEQGERELIALAAGCECSNSHPIARGIVNQARKMGVEISKLDNIRVVVGYGVQGTLDRAPVLVGNKEFMQKNNLPIIWHLWEEEKLKEEGLTVVWLALGEKVIGLIGLADTLREESRETVNQLRKLGVEKIALITGDNEKVAEGFAHPLGLNPLLANILPEEKLLAVVEEKSRGRIVAMVGDGFNDCPALNKSDIGIAVGTKGTDLALQSADIILVDDDLRKIIKMIRLSQTTTAVVRQNFLVSAAINLLGLFIALRGTLTPELASIINNLSTLGIVINSASILQRNSQIREDKDGKL